MKIVYDDVIREFSGVQYCGEPRGLCILRTYCDYDGYYNPVEGISYKRIARKGRYRGLHYKKKGK